MNAIDELHIETVRRELNLQWLVLVNDAREGYAQRNVDYGRLLECLHFRRLIAEARERERERRAAVERATVTWTFDPADDALWCPVGAWRPVGGPND